MRCDELMKRDVECCQRSDLVTDAAETMRDRNVGFLPVCNEHGEVIGTITDRDLAVRVLADGLPESTPVGDVMTSEVIACSPTDDVNEAEQRMRDYRKSRIVCVDDRGHAVGVISLSDLAASGRRNAATLLSAISQREVNV